MPTLKELEKILEEYKNPEKAKVLQGFFKTGKGQYGEGDIFFGIIVPDQRKIAKDFIELSLNDIKILLNSKIHEKRLIALFILIDKYKKSDREKNYDKKEQIFNFYIDNLKNVNNWDLVDLSAPNIIGEYLKDYKRDILYFLAKSDNIWKRRVAILSTFYFIKNNDFSDSLKISKMLLQDKHDLIQKVVGWMLREIGKRNLLVEENFLKNNYKKMPRTMLRYSIERFEEDKRKRYLTGKV